jgi:hypothetical protein
VLFSQRFGHDQRENARNSKRIIKEMLSNEVYSPMELLHEHSLQGFTESKLYTYQLHRKAQSLQ